jgi:hypothetical protein
LEKDVPEGQIRKGASVKIDAEGRFMMMTFRPGDGVVPGKYKVILLIRQKEDDPSTSLIPLKYTSPQTSGLEISIDKPHSDIEFVVEKR